MSDASNGGSVPMVGVCSNFRCGIYGQDQPLIFNVRGCAECRCWLAYRFDPLPETRTAPEGRIASC